MRSIPLFLVLTFCIVGVVKSQSNESVEQTKDASFESVDLSAGETLYKKSCKNCHGPTAKGMASFPKLTGNSAEYLIDRLTRYRDGEKFGPNTPLMMPQAANLSNADIANIANYISTELN